MSDVWKKHAEAVKDAFVEAAKEFADDEEVKGFFSEQATLYGKEAYYAQTTSGDEQQEHIDNITALVAQGESEVDRLAIAADNVAKARLKGALGGVGNLILNLVKGGILGG